MGEPVVSGMGVASPIGHGKETFFASLLNGAHAFSFLRRAGRQREASFVGAEIDDSTIDLALDSRVLRTVSLSAKVALYVLREAWTEAKLDRVDPSRIGLVVGGSNFQQRELALVHDAYRDRVDFLRPTYALSFMDSDVCGFCTEQLGIRGFAYTLGGASASGQLAITQAATAIQTGQVDVCIAAGALMDLSYWECQGLQAIGAMSNGSAVDPARASRPFDVDSDGFVFGESSGAIVLESFDSAMARGLKPYARLQGSGLAMDANRNPDPSSAGEIRAVSLALRNADWRASSVDYVNPHGTGSPSGDRAEVEALRGCGLERAHLNTTKSLIGHGLTSAGTVEVIATLLQMRFGRLHPSRNLDNPIDESLNWVRESSVARSIDRALSLSMGFGGVNTAICWQRV